MFGSNFVGWKLQNGSDYFFFFAMAVCGILFLYLLYVRLKKGRSDEGSKKRVIRQINRYRPKNGVFLHDVQLKIAGEELFFDHLIIDEKGIMPIKRYGWGLALYGTLDSETWKMKDQLKEELIPNPLLIFEQYEAKLTNWFGKQNIYGLHYHELVVLADTFDEPTIFVDAKAPVIPYAQLKKVMKKRQELPTVLPRYQEVADIIQKNRT